MTPQAWPREALPLLGEGRIGHTRHTPSRHRFAYGAHFLMLPMRALAGGVHGGLPVNRKAALSFHEADHGHGEPHGALRWVESVLAQAGVDGVDGEIWLQCFPRVLGYAFKPVSFWYAFDAQRQLRAVVAEVNNTFGQRHTYVLTDAQWGQTREAPKQFHVSPFCAVAGAYRFRFAWHDDRLVARVEHVDGQGEALIDTSWSGRLQAYSPALARRLLWRYPLQSVGVIVRIHWHALRLWLKRVPFHSLPPRAPMTVTVAPAERRFP